MESDRFDAFTRSVASRRLLLAKAGGGGLGALLLGTLGRQEAAAASTCLLDVRLFVRVGPSAGFPLVPKQTKTGQLVGQLRLKISAKGDLAGSTFLLADGSSLPVVGSVAGRQIGLRIALGQGQVLVLQGVDEGNVTACKGAIDGGLVGPKEGDLGDWHAVPVPTPATPTAATSSASATLTPIPGGSGSTGSTGGSTSGMGGSESLPSDTPPAPVDTSTSVPDTPTPTPGFVFCPECQTSLTRGTGGGTPTCQPVVDGSPCSMGSCCSGVCVSLFNDPNNCGACAMVCAGGCCQNGACCPTCTSGQTLCGANCVDLSNDPSNCGACGRTCSAGGSCAAGVCKKPVVTCPTGQINCGGTCVRAKVCP